MPSQYGGVAVPKPRSAVDKREAKRDKETQWRLVRQAVFERDGWRCRVCRTGEHVEVHHVRFKSVGGHDSTKNCAVLCRCCHADVHGYRLSLAGNANGVLTITRVVTLRTTE